MGRKKASASGDATQTNGAEGGGKQSIRQYWIGLLNEHPAWLSSRSNDRLYKKYLEDHPGETEVPKNWQQGLSTVKTGLRKDRKKRKKGRTAAASVENGTHAATAVHRKAPRSAHSLEQLEERIDEVLSLAKTLGHDGLDRVISNLKTARNAVIVMMAR
jgi:hypothetical protein